MDSNPNSEFDDEFYQKYIPKTYVDPHTQLLKCKNRNKLCFNTKTQARNERRMLELKYSKSFRIYQCDFCSYWHLASVDDKYKKNWKFKDRPE